MKHLLPADLAAALDEPPLDDPMQEVPFTANDVNGFHSRGDTIGTARYYGTEE